MSRREDELTLFVREGLSKGIGRPELKQVMLLAGWSADQADAALGAYSEVAFAVPVPAPRPYLSAQEAFLYLVLFTTLYLSAYALGKLCFEFIEQAFPDAVYQSYNTQDSIRWSIAYLIVALPVYVFAAYQVKRMLAGDPTKAGSPTRKWLTYMALSIAVVFLVGDLVTLVFYALGGELTVRFLLKVLTVGVISGAIFGYYLTDLKRDDARK